VGLIGGTVGYWILKKICAGGDSGYLSGEAYANRSKLAVLFGDAFFDEIRDRTVIDFGCGTGGEAVEMAHRGARRVIGVDIREKWLDAARRHALEEGVSDRCVFLSEPDQPADVIVSVDSFEHFDDPAHILRVMDGYLAPGGRILASFGPTWFHPLGGHLFSVFPWAHLLFTEKALLRWRKSIRPNQTATRITDCGLNKITIRRFERIVANSPFRFERLETRPIRGIQLLANPLLREFGTAIVRCTLVRRSESGASALAA
jgi:2-polyprenyl-3-methyl-5-hydroxy-6-metoxy-1,4-benzoquinol methylase